MIFSLIFGLLLGALTVIFALQNMVVISVTFLFWDLQGSLALILLLAVAAGVLICLFLSIPEVIKDHIAFRVLKEENKKLQDEVASYKRVIEPISK